MVTARGRNLEGPARSLLSVYLGQVEVRHHLVLAMRDRPPLGWDLLFAADLRDDLRQVVRRG